MANKSSPRPLQLDIYLLQLLLSKLEGTLSDLTTTFKVQFHKFDFSNPIEKKIHSHWQYFFQIREVLELVG
jgi:hypothetical protein